LDTTTARFCRAVSGYFLQSNLRWLAFTRYVVNYETLRRFLEDASGATAIEYGLIAAGIAPAIISAGNGVGTKLKTNFGTISTSLK